MREKQKGIVTGVVQQKGQEVKTLTAKDLNQYRAIKTEITDLNRRIMETREKEACLYAAENDTGRKYSYILNGSLIYDINSSVTGQRERNIAELVKQREIQKDNLIKQQLEIEKFIAAIRDSYTRVIFRMYFLDGMTQEQIAGKICLDRSVISRRIRSYVSCTKSTK